LQLSIAPRLVRVLRPFRDECAQSLGRRLVDGLVDDAGNTRDPNLWLRVLLAVHSRLAGRAPFLQEQRNRLLRRSIELCRNLDPGLEADHDTGELVQALIEANQLEVAAELASRTRPGYGLHRQWSSLARRLTQEGPLEKAIALIPVAGSGHAGTIGTTIARSLLDRSDWTMLSRLLADKTIAVQGLQWKDLINPALEQGHLDDLLDCLSHLDDAGNRDAAFVECAEALAAAQRKDLALATVLRIAGHDAQTKALEQVALALASAGLPEESLSVLEAMGSVLNRWMATIEVAEALARAGKFQQAICLIGVMVAAVEHPIDTGFAAQADRGETPVMSTRRMMNQIEGRFMAVQGLARLAYLAAPSLPEVAFEMISAVFEQGMCSKARYLQVLRRIVVNLALDTRDAQHWRIKPHFTRKQVPFVHHLWRAVAAPVPQEPGQVAAQTP
jgi:hypothetical protein